MANTLIGFWGTVDETSSFVSPKPEGENMSEGRSFVPGDHPAVNRHTLAIAARIRFEDVLRAYGVPVADNPTTKPTDAPTPTDAPRPSPHRPSSISPRKER